MKAPKGQYGQFIVNPFSNSQPVQIAKKRSDMFALPGSENQSGGGILN